VQLTEKPSLTVRVVMQFRRLFERACIERTYHLLIDNDPHRSVPYAWVSLMPPTLLLARALTTFKND
jgi:hypothetical protein